MKRIVVVCLVAFMLMPLGAVFSASLSRNDAFTIKVGTNQKGPDEMKQFDEAVGRFHKNYPNAKIDLDTGVDTSDWSDYAQRLLTQIASGENKDIIWMAIEGIRFLVSNDCLVPLDDYVAKSPSLKAQIKDVQPLVLRCFQYQNKLWALPLGWNNAHIVINTKLFKDAGITPDVNWTWDDFLKVAQKLTKKVNGNQQWGFALQDGNIQGTMLWLAANDTFTMNENMDESWFAHPKTIQTYQFLYDLVNKYKVMPRPEDGVNYWTLLANGRIAMVTGGAWVITQFSQLGFKDYDFLPIPYKSSKGTSLGADAYSMVKGTKYPDQVVEFMQELTGPDIQTTMARLGTSIPTSMKVSQSRLFLDHAPHLYILEESLKWPNARLISSPTFYPDMFMSWKKNWQLALSNKITVQQALLNTDADTKELIKNNKQ